MKKDVEVKILRENIKKLQDWQMKRLQTGPLANLQNKDKVKQFVDLAYRLQQGNKLESDKLDVI